MTHFYESPPEWPFWWSLISYGGTSPCACIFAYKDDLEQIIYSYVVVPQ